MIKSRQGGFMSRRFSTVRHIHFFWCFAVLTALCITSCEHSSEKNLYIESAFAAELSNRIEQIKNGDCENVIQFNELTDFAWDSCYIFPPYTDEKIISQTLGFKWDGIENSKIRNYDDICLLVFVHKSDVIFYCEYPRAKGDFMELKDYTYHPLDAIFSIKIEENNDLDFPEWISIYKK